VLEGNNIDGSTMSPEPDTPQTDAMDIISSSGFDFSSLFKDDSGVQRSSGAPALHSAVHGGGSGGWGLGQWRRWRASGWGGA